MINRHVIYFAIAVCAIGNTAAWAEREPGITDRVEKSFPAKPGGLLTFESNIASAHIETANTDRVRVEIERTARVATQAEADELLKKLSLEMVPENAGVRITALGPEERNWRGGSRLHLKARITIPRKFNVELRTVGSSSVADLDGTAKLATSGGSLKVGNVSGPVTAKSGGGSITIGDVGGDLEARSGGGSIKTGRVAGRVIANAGGGSITIAEATDAIEATAQGGSVSAYISKQPRSACKLIANAGSVDLRLADTAAMTVDAECSAGRIKSDFAVQSSGTASSGRLKGDIAGGGPALVLRAAAGSINLRKEAP
jgi:hypothetical protein